MEGTIGEVRMFAGTFAPRNWAFCAGQTIAISDNQTLYSVIGTTYGGDGRTTFQLPDLRGRVPLGPGRHPGSQFDWREGQAAGAEGHTLTSSQLAQHSHTATFTPTGATNNMAVGIDVADVNGTVATPTGNLLAITADGRAQHTTYAPTTAATGGELGGVSVSGECVTNGEVTVNSTGDSQAFSLMQPSLAVHFIICMEGVYPSRN